MDRAVRALLVGCGGISRTWIKAAQEIPGLDIVGFVDIDAGAAAGATRAYGRPGVEASTDLEAALARLRPEAVLNCTVPEAHVPVTLTALRHGCHVLTEKPLADSMAGARELLTAAQAAGRTLAVIQNRRYDARVRRLRAFLDSSAIGPVREVHCDFYIGAHFGGFRDHMPHVLLLDMAIHTFDAARLLTGADPLSAYCHEWNPAGSWYDRDASAMAVFQMTQGIVYTYRGSWCAEGLNTTWESEWRIIGTRGSVWWDGAEGFRAEVVAQSGAFRSEMRSVEVPAHDAGGKEGGHAGNIREFVRCLRSGSTPETSAADNIKSLAMVFAAIESAEAGRPVPID